MPVIATDTQRISNTVKFETAPEKAYCRNVLVYNGAAKTFNVGDLVAVAAGVPAAAANVVGIVLETTVAPLNTNTNVLVMHRGPASVSKFGITLNGLVAADVYALLETKGIQVLDAV